MAKLKVTIDIDLLHEVDRWVAEGAFPNRSRAVQAGLTRLRADRTRRQSLLGALAKLDPIEERASAEEWLEGEPRYPEY